VTGRSIRVTGLVATGPPSSQASTTQCVIANSHHPLAATTLQTSVTEAVVGFTSIVAGGLKVAAGGLKVAAGSLKVAACGLNLVADGINSASIWQLKTPTRQLMTFNPELSATGATSPPT